VLPLTQLREYDTITYRGFLCGGGERMFLADGWKDYQLIDCSQGEKLERWGDYLLIRPDPQIVWELAPEQKSPLWKQADARYIRSKTGGGRWEVYHKLPDAWTIDYKNLTFAVKPMGFKHTGLFPEQAANWDWMHHLITESGRSDVNVLNLFAYTGGATAAVSHAGASVCHVDAAKGMVTWAKDNATLSNLREKPVRYIVDDVIKFVQREHRRGNKYDAIIMDPPSYGRGPNGEVWKLENELYGLISSCIDILSDDPLFMIVNSYTSGVSSTIISNLISLTVKKKFGGIVTNDEIAIPIKASGLYLPCGAATRWINEM